MARQTRTLVKGLRGMWPRAIPAADYEFMLLYLRRLEGAQDEEKAPPPPRVATRAVKAKSPRMAAPVVRTPARGARGDAVDLALAAVAEAKGEITAKEIEGKTGLGSIVVRRALLVLTSKGKVTRRRLPRIGRGGGIPYAYTLKGRAAKAPAAPPPRLGLKLLTKAGAPRERAPQKSMEEIQGLVMLALEDAPEGLTKQQLAEQTGFTDQNLSRPMLDLTHKNLVTRRRQVDPTKPNPPFVYARVKPAKEGVGR
jgi:predicted transcriptional regulator